MADPIKHSVHTEELESERVESTQARHPFSRPIKLLYAALVIAVFGGVACYFIVKGGVAEYELQALRTQYAAELRNEQARQSEIISLVKRANTLYEANNTDPDAKKLYERTAKLGSPDAHLALAYRYVVTFDQGVFHFSEAARRGNQEAMKYLLDDLFWRANSPFRADPAKVYEIYKEGVIANPSLYLFSGYDAQEYSDVFFQAIEVGPIDQTYFASTYRIDRAVQEAEPESGDFYWVWKLAEESSKPGKYGAPDPKRTLQLIISGCSVPAECKAAVSDFYDAWKQGVVKEFKICDYVVSRVGINYCLGYALPPIGN